MTAPDRAAEPAVVPLHVDALIPGLSAAPPEVRAFVASCLVEEHFAFGDEIVRPGDGWPAALPRVRLGARGRG